MIVITISIPLIISMICGLSAWFKVIIMGLVGAYGNGGKVMPPICLDNRSRFPILLVLFPLLIIIGMGPPPNSSSQARGTQLSLMPTSRLTITFTSLTCWSWSAVQDTTAPSNGLPAHPQYASLIGRSFCAHIPTVYLQNIFRQALLQDSGSGLTVGVAACSKHRGITHQHQPTQLL